MDCKFWDPRARCSRDFQLSNHFDRVYFLEAKIIWCPFASEQRREMIITCETYTHTVKALMKMEYRQRVFSAIWRIADASSYVVRYRLEKVIMNWSINIGMLMVPIYLKIIMSYSMGLLNTLSRPRLRNS